MEAKCSATVRYGRSPPRRRDVGGMPLASPAWFSAQQGLAWLSHSDLLAPHSPVFPSLSSQPARPRCNSSRCCRSSLSTSSTLGLVLPGFHGGCSHQSSPLSCRNSNCSSRSAVSVTSPACVVLSIGLRVQARHSSHPSLPLRSRKPTSCLKRAQKTSTICRPVSSVALQTRVKRFL